MAAGWACSFAPRGCCTQVLITVHQRPARGGAIGRWMKEELRGKRRGTMMSRMRCFANEDHIRVKIGDKAMNPAMTWAAL